MAVGGAWAGFIIWVVLLRLPVEAGLFGVAASLSIINIVSGTRP